MNSPLSAETVAVFITKNPKDISALSAACERMSSIKTILVLPDQSEDTINRALLLYPRFTAAIDESIGLLSSVLTKTIRK